MVKRKKKSKSVSFHLRRDYMAEHFSEKQIKKSPMAQFGIWFEDAAKRNVQDVNAFVLATADSKKNPSARVLLMKSYSSKGITFFTNYQSNKGKQIQTNPKAEAVFFWNDLNRQVRLSGVIKKISARESLKYFRSRPREAQIAAAISAQSSTIASRKDLEQKYKDLEGVLQGELPAMPKNWGGYQLVLNQAEFWQGRPGRLHDRLIYQASKTGRWKVSRLQP